MDFKKHFSRRRLFLKMAGVFSTGMALNLFGNHSAFAGTGQPVRLWRLYNPSTDDHFYTTNYDEAYPYPYGYWPEGENGWAAVVFDDAKYNGSGVLLTEPLYRIYITTNQTHFYTTDYNEYHSLIWNDFITYQDEGISCYILNDIGRTYFTSEKFWRLYNGNAHFYTGDSGEMINAVANGYNVEGMIGYVIPSDVWGQIG